MVGKRVIEGGSTPQHTGLDPSLLKPLKRIKKDAVPLVRDQPLSIRRAERLEAATPPSVDVPVGEEVMLPTSSPLSLNGEKNNQVLVLSSSVLGPLKRLRKDVPIVRDHPLSIRRARLQPARPKKRQKAGQKKIFEYLKEEEKEEEPKIFRCVCGKGTAENPGGLIIQCDICKIWLHKRCTHRGYGSTRKKKRVFVCLQCHFNPPNIWGEREEDPSKEPKTPKKTVRFKENSERLFFSQKKCSNTLLNERAPHNFPT